MDLRGWWSEQSTDVKIIAAVSFLLVVPVTVLAIVTLAAGIVGITFLGGAGAPSATFDCTVGDDRITFEHVDGANIDQNQLEVGNASGTVEDIRFSDQPIEEGDEIVVEGPTSAELLYDGFGVDEPVMVAECS